MALLCIGQYVDRQDATKHCIENSLIFLGFDPKDPKYYDIHEVFEEIPVGTLVAVKSWSPTEDVGLTIKGLAIVSETGIYHTMFNGVPRRARKVRFIWAGNENFGKPEDGWGNIRNGTLYFEPSPSVITRIVSLVK
jgi:hypothetical protein